MDFYNILLHNVPDEEAVESTLGGGGGRGFGQLEQAKRRHLKRLQQDSLSELMNGPIRKKLGIIPSNVTWGGLCVCECVCVCVCVCVLVYVCVCFLLYV